MAAPSSVIEQAAAIPVHQGELCVVTSRTGRRWVFPKGRIEAGTTAKETALREAWEEAGLVGTLDPEPVGSYLYTKEGRSHLVLVFILRVAAAEDDWPECHSRDRDWVSPAEAATRVDEPGLRQILKRVFLLRKAT